MLFKIDIAVTVVFLALITTLENPNNIETTKPAFVIEDRIMKNEFL